MLGDSKRVESTTVTAKRLDYPRSSKFGPLTLISTEKKIRFLRHVQEGANAVSSLAKGPAAKDYCKKIIFQTKYYYGCVLFHAEFYDPSSFAAIKIELENASFANLTAKDPWEWVQNTRLLAPTTQDLFLYQSEA